MSLKIFDDKIGLMPDGIGPGVSVSGAGDQISGAAVKTKHDTGEKFQGVLFDIDGVLMIGDRVAADILGARRAGIKSVLVKTGEFKESDLTGDVQPDFIVDSINEIEALF